MRPAPLQLTLLLDPLEEGWPSMDLCGEALAEGLRGLGPGACDVRVVRPALARAARRVSPGSRAAFNADRVLTRHVTYPRLAHALAARSGPGALFHVVDHTYAALVHALPAARTGVYCYDLDAFRSVLEPARDPRPAWFRALAHRALMGLRRASRVFYATGAVREELVGLARIREDRLVHAPLGVSPEFSPEGPGPLEPGPPYLLHVGSALPRRRLDVLLDVAAAVLRAHPGLRLVQVGARLPPERLAQVERLGLGPRLLQPPHLPRAALAALYRGAACVLVTSEAEGFGLPVVEALACGAPVVASDIPVLREVGGPAPTYAPVGDVAAWTAAVLRVLEGAGPPRAARLAQAARFRWEVHARTIAEAYSGLGRTG